MCVCKQLLLYTKESLAFCSFLKLICAYLFIDNTSARYRRTLSNKTKHLSIT